MDLGLNLMCSILFKPLFQIEVTVGNVHDVIFHLHSRQNKHAQGMGVKGGGSKSLVGVVKWVVVSFSKGSSKFGFFGPGGGSKKKTYLPSTHTRISARNWQLKNS